MVGHNIKTTSGEGGLCGAYSERGPPVLESQGIEIYEVGRGFLPRWATLASDMPWHEWTAGL
jgi:hypothetical protein